MVCLFTVLNRLIKSTKEFSISSAATDQGSNELIKIKNAHNALKYLSHLLNYN